MWTSVHIRCSGIYGGPDQAVLREVETEPNVKVECVAKFSYDMDVTLGAMVVVWRRQLGLECLG